MSGLRQHAVAVLSELRKLRDFNDRLSGDVRSLVCPLVVPLCCCCLTASRFQVDSLGAAVMTQKAEAIEVRREAAEHQRRTEEHAAMLNEHKQVRCAGSSVLLR